MDELFHVAFTAEREETQLAATVTWLNRFEGKPIAMTAHVTTSDPSALNDADLDHELRLHATRMQKKAQKE